MLQCNISYQWAGVIIHLRYLQKFIKIKWRRGHCLSSTLKEDESFDPRKRWAFSAWRRSARDWRVSDNGAAKIPSRGQQGDLKGKNQILQKTCSSQRPCFTSELAVAQKPNQPEWHHHGWKAWRTSVIFKATWFQRYQFNLLSELWPSMCSVLFFNFFAKPLYGLKRLVKFDCITA